MSSALQAVMFLPRVLTGAGYFPDLTPDHQVERLTGMTARIEGNLTNPV